MWNHNKRKNGGGEWFTQIQSSEFKGRLEKKVLTRANGGKRGARALNKWQAIELSKEAEKLIVMVRDTN